MTPIEEDAHVLEKEIMEWYASPYKTTLYDICLKSLTNAIASTIDHDCKSGCSCGNGCDDV